MTTRIRIAIVGCGDALHRHYLPPLEGMADRVAIAGFSDARLDAARHAADVVRAWSPDAAAFDDLATMLTTVRPDAVFNLTPAPLHAAVNAECLAAGAHVYSEKPLATSIAEADGLIAEARKLGRLLLCAPASAVTREVRWLGGVIASGRLGRPTLATAWIGSMGPAAWAEYTGDPTVFYGPTVGPIRDIGVYRLHELTSLLGPVRKVAAMGSIAIPKRTIEAGTRAGGTVTVTTPDHVLVHLEFANGALGQLLASYALPASRAPWLEIHLTDGTISLSGDPYSTDDPADVYVRSSSGAAAAAEAADASAGLGRLAAGWNDRLSPPAPAETPLIGRGPEHFIACVEGAETPVLTAEHARHVLEVVLRVYESIESGRAVELTTTFDPPAYAPPAA